MRISDWSSDVCSSDLSARKSGGLGEENIMDLGIAGRTALVLGGSKGIGRQIALDFADAGANVVVVARGKEAIDRTVADVRGKGVKAIGISADLLDLESYQKIQDQAVAELAAPAKIGRASCGGRG